MKHIVKTSLFACISIFFTNNLIALPELSTTAAFETAIYNNELVIIDFYMPFCGPCKKIAPLLEELARQFLNIRIFKVDITNEEFETLAQKYSIRSVPCLVFLKHGVEMGRHKGGNVSKEELEEKIKTIFSI